MPEKKFSIYAHQNITDEDIDSIIQALKSEFITRGPIVEAFEEGISKYCGSNYAVAFNSGTAALMAAYDSAEIGNMDTILTTPNSFVATTGAAVQKHANPVFIDINQKTGNLDLEQLSQNINHPSTRGKKVLVPVHFAGIPVDMQALDYMIADPKTIVIEDAAHALGSKYKDGSRVGSCSWSHMTIFSFHPAKIITTGEGGMVTTNDEETYHKLKRYRNNGIERNPFYLKNESAPWYYEVLELTGNYNFTEMQAALGLSQLKRLESMIAKRQKLILHYKKKLKSLENIEMVQGSPNDFIAPALCVVLIDFKAYKTTRTQVMEKLKNLGIGTQVHYIPIYRHPVFVNRFGDISSYFPEMENYYCQALSLPLFVDLNEEDVDEIVESLKNTLLC